MKNTVWAMYVQFITISKQVKRCHRKCIDFVYKQFCINVLKFKLYFFKYYSINLNYIEIFINA